MVAEHIAGHMAHEGVESRGPEALWRIKANKSMNDFYRSQSAGRLSPKQREQPNICSDYATHLLPIHYCVFSKYSDDLRPEVITGAPDLFVRSWLIR